MKNPVKTLKTLWRIPGGRWLINRVLGLIIPYTGSIGAEIVEFSPGKVMVKMRDRRAVRNHLKSVHAIALANLAELTTGLATSLVMRDDQRSILKGFQITYLKKARGTLHGVCTFTLPPGFTEGDVHVHVDVIDSNEVVVCEAIATWKVS